MEISAEKTRLMSKSANGILREIKVKWQNLGTVQASSTSEQLFHTMAPNQRVSQGLHKPLQPFLKKRKEKLKYVPGLATYFRFSFRFFKKGSCQLLAKVCARSTGYRLGGLSLPRKSVVRLIDRPDMTLDVYRGRKTTNQQKSTFTKLKPIWSDENISLGSKVKPMCSLVIPINVFLYACESWALTAEIEKRNWPLR